MALLRAVVDTNIFVSGMLTTGGTSHQLLETWRLGAFTLVMGSTQREELERVLRRPLFAERYGLTAVQVDYWLLLVDLMGLRVPERRRLPVHVRDPKDDHLLAAALGGHADCLVTGDADILAMKDEPKLKALRIVTAAVFLGLVAAEGS